MEAQKPTSRTSLLNSMLLKAWKERWTDAQWGINIKTVLPRGVSGDVYNLADCILQQALIGSSINELVLSYLRHSLCANLISHAAVLKRISKYDQCGGGKIFCVISLLEFLDAIIDGVTCRSKPEESILPNAVVSLIYWLMQKFFSVVEMYECNGQLTQEQRIMLDMIAKVIDKIIKNDFLLGILYIGKQEDLDFYIKITNKYSDIKNSITMNGFYNENCIKIDEQLHQLAYLDVKQLYMKNLDKINCEPITYCAQPLLSLIVLLNPCNDTQYYVNELLMIKNLKNFTTSRLFYEIIRAGFISLSNVIETTHDTMWGAFTFIKVPHILKQINSMSQIHTENLDYLPDVVEAFEMLLEDTSILDFMDTKCYCNTIEYLLNDWGKQRLVNEMHIKQFSAKRESVLPLIQRREVNNQASSIINLVLRAEVPLSGILKTLNADYNKVQEALLGMLCQVLVGNSFELILSVATVEGRLKTFVSRLIKCNENSKQVPGEIGKAAIVRSTLFDVSFLMLTFIVQTYGSDVVLSESPGDTFFEKWVRECMVERNKVKSPRNMVALCDENIVDELLLSLSKPDAQLKSSITWQDICMNIPGVLYQVLVSWENDTLSSADVKKILDSIKMRLFSFSVCAASYLCAYMQTVREDEFLKPINMVQQFLSTLSMDEMPSQENIKERLGLTFQIIRKMQHDIHPSGNSKPRSLALTQTNIISNAPLEEQFREVWKNIADRGWLPIKSAQILESLLQACGPAWIVTKAFDEVLKCRFTRDMTKTMDIIFAVMHLDIERTTIALLDNLVPSIIFNKLQKHITEPQSAILAKLCVYCIISNLEAPQTYNSNSSNDLINGNNINNKKRNRNDTDDSDITSTASKLRKLNQTSELSPSSSSSSGSDSSSSSEFFSENLNIKEQESISSQSTSTSTTTTTLNEALQTSLQQLFKIFSITVITDELSPKIYFIYQFISFLVECGKDRILPILKLIPNNLIQNLLKVMITDDISVGLICRLYDLRSPQGRQAAVSDLCLLRNINLRKNSIEL